MKKLFFAALVAVSLSATAYAQNVPSLDKRAVDNFEATFTDASNVEWVSKDKFTKAFFIQNEKNVEAYYDLNGDFIATTTAIDEEELPASVKTTFEKKYAGYNLTEALELTSYDETAYFLTAERGKDKIIVKVKGTWFSLYSKLQSPF